MKNIHKVLFVCTGNSCRSIMAEAYARKRFREEGLRVEARSAGTLGISGISPTKEALKVLSINNVEAAGLESTPLTPELIDWADIVLVMEPAHKKIAAELVPGGRDKVRYLGEYRTSPGDIVIPDPIGRSLSFYRASFRMIREPIEEFIKWLKE